MIVIQKYLKMLVQILIQAIVIQIVLKLAKVILVHQTAEHQLVLVQIQQFLKKFQ